MHETQHGRGITAFHTWFCPCDNTTTLPFPASQPSWGHAIYLHLSHHGSPCSGLCQGPRTPSPSRGQPAGASREGCWQASHLPSHTEGRLLQAALARRCLRAGALQQQGKENQSVLLLSIRESLKATCWLTEAAAARKFQPPPPSFFFLNDSNVLINLG